MTRLHIRLRDFGRTYGWDGLATFVSHLGPDSATYRSQYPEQSGWTRADMMLADVFDELERLRYSIDAKLAKSRPPKPVRYPRPWEKAKYHYGAGAIPVSDFWDWWAEGD